MIGKVVLLFGYRLQFHLNFHKFFGRKEENMVRQIAVSIIFLVVAITAFSVIQISFASEKPGPAEILHHKPAGNTVAKNPAPFFSLDSFTATPAIPIPDNTYNGTLGTMACSTINTAALPPTSVVNDVSVQIAMSHTFVGDLTIKLIAPSGSLLGIVSRPGVIETADDGNDTAGFGENSNLAIANPLTYHGFTTASSEQMGRTPIDLATGQTICVDGGTPCTYTPSAGAIAGGVGTFAGFDGQNAVGNWQLCIGDSAGADTGTFQSWTLTLQTSLVTAANAAISGRVVTPGGRGIGNAMLVLTGGNLPQHRIYRTNPLGYYMFDDLPTGQTYVLSIGGSKSYTFANPTRVITLQDSITDMDFVSN
jgi:subtilisin-like proprotein convertase family protein